MIIQTGKALKLHLSRDLERALKQGHPWVFKDALASPPDGAPGQIALLLDKRKNALALGYSDPDSALSFRACTVKKRAKLNDDWAIERLEAAISLRERLFAGTETTGYRLVNGEGDGLPGLVVDRYGSGACIRLDGPAAEAFWRRGEGVAEFLAERLDLDVIYGRARARGGARGWPLVGDVPPEPLPFQEGACLFTADVVSGQKTGFFLDQRGNRLAVASLSKGLKVLNVFSYTGGFSVNAGIGGATSVTSVDMAKGAINDANRHWVLNGLKPENHTGVVADAFEFLKNSEEKWDMVILDPPSFAPNNDAKEGAIRAYGRLIELGARRVSPGGYLVAASCSSHVDMPAFRGAALMAIGRARRQGQLIREAGQGMDHPTPAALPEMRYLKCLIFRI